MNPRRAQQPGTKLLPRAALASVVALACSTAAAVGEPAPLQLKLSPRTPNQVAAFYEARGFPDAALERIRAACFVTVGLRNKTDKVVWLELARWRVTSATGTVRRITREDWAGTWQEVGVAAAQQSTFGWTLLPEGRDLRPDEPVGGNLTLVRTGEPFTLEAIFKTGPNRRDGEIQLRYENLQCASDP
jgi:hypothetical protein